MPVREKGNEGWIETYMGIAFRFSEPDMERVFAADIAHALSMKCRVNGHVRFHYSVAQHSVLMVEWFRENGFPLDTQRMALLHDAHEAYLPDVPAPIKPHLPGWRDMENAVQEAIDSRFLEPLPANRWDNHAYAVKLVDAKICITEARTLMPSMARRWNWAKDVEPLDVIVQSLTPEQVKGLFMNEFVRLFPDVSPVGVSDLQGLPFYTGSDNFRP